ncbi:hypothetical protein [Geminicoccus harenae]|uniref:hypothetical protein n=1 Tax=Geminicoccus harenae TaxID=2498453 RepID=UPI00168BE896|nr:hypothetical protein [Geminicoccus harenae]
MGWPQYVYIALTLIGLSVSLANHDQPKKGKENAIPTILAMVLVYYLLWKGGFFSEAHL